MSLKPSRYLPSVRSERLWLVVVGAILAAFVFLNQNRVVGWEPGYNELQPGHHGWVSSHTLAIIAHATPANGFVGYALASVDEAGHVDYDYFDRYPVYFSAAMHGLLSLKARLSTQIYLAKQAMNGIFLLTVLVAYLLLRKLSLASLPALAASLLAVSSPYLLFYKDMAHYDQPALLGMLILILAIAHYKAGSSPYLVYGGALLATSLGRGYASLAVLGVWLVLEVVRVVQTRPPSPRAFLATVVSLASMHALLLGTVWAALNLGYNIGVEASRRGIALADTSIIHSAVNRLSLNQEFNASYADLLQWRYFFSDELIRLVRWSLPVWNYEGSVVLSVGIVAVMVLVIILFGRRLDPGRQQVMGVLTLSGPVWLVAMRNLSAFHDYTAMYFLGISLAFFASLAGLIRLPRLGWVLAVALSLAVFGARHAQIQDLHREIGSPYSSYTHDYMRIAAVLPSGGQRIFLADGVPYAPYAFGFYLPADVLAPVDHADYVITRNPKLGGENLTPDNSHVFLLQNP